MKLFEIVDKPIEVEQVIAKVESRKAGAITTFTGVVREWTKGKRTLFLEYQAYVPMAEKMLAKIGDEIQRKWPGTIVAISHRIGRLDISDIAVVIAVSSPHRRAAYEANEYAIERIKQMVPIWKKEHWENGEAWIGDQLENVPYPDGKPNIAEGDMK
ncbi:molybdenum cofactor biosynthesis protein MoaE [Pallidibacillus pasinlerensis]|uniref:Molybdenum cofactor biosynthesis protein MoaE n=1 Tax=Pallidibacillus pasinlerensis TaxID=2703818 RepID=A0ABX0A303_9BACI|nr:molybdenum cofactor biosynthesis protein MoaE [Pallidibacillus pasinlerensis]NCU17824.1 molybdenum cofactor biosynthesis protein MoaE [Pallidibacillus pasinlerensis]